MEAGQLALTDRLGTGIWKRITGARWAPALAASLVLLGLGGSLKPGYVTWDNLNQILAVASILTIASAGQTLVMISGGYGIDLSVGQVMSLTAVIAYTQLQGSDSNLPWALTAVLGTGLILGSLNGLGIVGARLPPLVMTLGTMVIAQGITFASTQGGSPAGRAAPLLLALNSGFMGVRGLTILAIVIVFALEALLRFTRYGRMLYLIGSNRRAAELSGVPVRRYVFMTYALSGVFNALAGMALLGYAGTANLDLGGGYTLPTVAAVVIGGTSLAGGQGSYAGTALGAVTMVILTTVLLTVGASEAVRQFIMGSILLLLLLFSARGPRLRQ
jgi:ribose transport system permease protein